ncbi:MAG TPA: hypothetical protein DCZ20_07595 [Lachnospiraceae bacterium]|nr:hypothetical protein [Lachnospiraceae bacterium]
MREIGDAAGVLVLLLLSIMDLKNHRISCRILVGITILVMGYRIWCSAEDLLPYWEGMLPGVFCLAVSFFTGQAIGFGDSWMILILGFYLGIWKTAVLLMVAFFLAGFYSICLLARKMLSSGRGKRCWQNSRKEKFAFLPALMIAFMYVVYR